MVDQTSSKVDVVDIFDDILRLDDQNLDIHCLYKSLYLAQIVLVCFYRKSLRNVLYYVLYVGNQQFHFVSILPKSDSYHLGHLLYILVIAVSNYALFETLEEFLLRIFLQVKSIQRKHHMQGQI